MQRPPIIVQISDLHFGRSIKYYDFWRRSEDHDARAALHVALVTLAPDFIVVTGDLTNGGRSSELRDCRTFLTSILDELWLGKQHVTRCIVIPGNHDVWPTTVASPGSVWRRNRLKRWERVYPGWSFLSERVTEQHASPLTPFRLDDYFLDKKVTEKAEHARQLADDAIRCCEFFPAFDLAFLKLDSNRRPSRWLPSHIARGRLSLAQRREVDQTLTAYQAATANSTRRFADTRKVALLHHHLTRLPNVSFENWMLLHDAGEVSKWLANWGVRFVLHGHYHQPDVLGLTFWKDGDASLAREMLVVSAGSATKRDVANSNSFHVIEMTPFQTSVRRPTIRHGECHLDVAPRFGFAHRTSLSIPDAPSWLLLDTLETSLMIADGYPDWEHSYDLIRAEGVIDEDRSYLGSVILEGRNAGAGPTSSLPFLFAAVGVQPFDECECHAFDLMTNQELERPTVLPNRPQAVYPCKVYFAAPVEPQGGFKIAVTFRLRYVMGNDWDYDMFHLLRFPRGVRKFELRMLSPRTIVGPSALEIRGDQLHKSSARVLPIDAMSFHPAMQKQLKGFSLSVEDPHAHSYILLYEKLGSPE